jgi:hypothetical protein
MSERMQALLSRAVEDQLSEQRQLAGAIADFRAQLGRLAQELEALRLPSAAGGEPMQAGLDAVSNELRTSVRLLGERLDEVQTGVAQVREAIAGITGGLGSLPSFGDRVAALQEAVASTGERLGALGELRDALGQVQQRVDGVDVDVREMRGAFTGIAARVADLPGRADVDAIVSRAVGAGAGGAGAGGAERLDALETGLGELTRRIEELSSSLGAHTDRVVEAVDRTAGAAPADGGGPDGGLGARLDALEAGIAAVRERLDRPPAPAEPGAGEGADERLDEVLAAVRDLHERIAGEDGVEAQLAELSAPAEAADDDQLAGAIRDAVRAEVAETERRLTEHVDEAVLALAEALLRRRAPRPAPVRTTTTRTTTVRTLPPEPAPGQPSGGPRAPAPAAAPADAASAPPQPPAAPPTEPAAQPAEPAAQDDEPASEVPPSTGVDVTPAPAPEKRRRPWWRPGD